MVASYYYASGHAAVCARTIDGRALDIIMDQPLMAMPPSPMLVVLIQFLLVLWRRKQKTNWALGWWRCGVARQAKITPAAT
eukprot:6888224-Pyramimonas_sp.AAC.1